MDTAKPLAVVSHQEIEVFQRMLTATSHSDATSPAIWSRLWKHRPSDDRDTEMLAREERSPRWALILDRIESTFGSVRGLETVELGSGRGDLSALLAGRGARTTLLDANEQALAQAQHRFARLGLDARYEQRNMFDTPPAWRGRFDISLSSGVIEHFKCDDRTRVIDAHHQVLKPGGMAIISIPHAWCLPYRLWKFYLDLRGWWPYGMELPYTKRELARRAGQVGFVRSETRCMGFWLSVGSQWGQMLLGYRPAWSDRRSWLDSTMGVTLVLVAWRAPETPRNA